jgi:hypothetical protein
MVFFLYNFTFNLSIYLEILKINLMNKNTQKGF